MELSGLAGWYVRHFYNRKDVFTKGFVERSTETTVAQTTTYGGWVVISSKDSAVGTLLDTGRLLQRMLLRAQDKLIGVHPMSQMLEEAPWRDDVARELGVHDQIQFILRVGYVTKYLEPVSLRRPPEWFVHA